VCVIVYVSVRCRLSSFQAPKVRERGGCLSAIVDKEPCPFGILRGNEIEDFCQERLYLISDFGNVAMIVDC
jgi:hypothetical protein